MRRTPARIVAGFVTVPILIGLQQWLVLTPAAGASPWQEDVQRVTSVAVRKAVGGSRKASRAASFVPASSTWPAPATVTVDLAVADPGTQVPVEGTPVELTPANPPSPGDAATVEIADRETTASLVGAGVVAGVTLEQGTSASVAIDYSSFGSAVGAGWASRLRLVGLPACALTTPDEPRCQVQTDLGSVNDTDAEVVSATVTAPAAGTTTTGAAMTTAVVAAAAATSSEQGDYSATPLRESSSWSAGSNSGSFTWSYPLEVPQVPGGLEPALSIDYSSGGTDGGVSNTNNQASWVGEGFELGSAFIERKYANCYEDRGSGNNSSSTAVDLCWDTDSARTNNQKWDNAFLSMAGHTGELVREANTSNWRLKEDDGTRVAKIGTPSDNDEYWRVTLPDGVQYFFGRYDAASTNPTNSTWSVPVYGNHSGEPGHKSSFGSSQVSRPWRWNLDYVIDPTGNSMTYFYVAETNNYKRNSATSTTYDRGGYLDHILYGERQGAETADDSPAKVTFTAEERCGTTVSATCLQAVPTTATAAAWPDVPLDAICVKSVYCPDEKKSPTFFSRKRLSMVETWTRDLAGTAWQAVDAFALTASFPAPSDHTAVPSLWLSTITRTAKAGADIVLPPVTLAPIMLKSRITTSTELEKPRLSIITSETGALTFVEYSQPDCTTQTVPKESAIPTNATRCMPVYYSGSETASPTLQWFNKYVVTSVTQRDLTAFNDLNLDSLDLDLDSDIVTSYSYGGDAAWRYNDSPMTRKKYRTWGQWRGYGTVTTVVGSGPTKQVDEGLYFRGMNGDKAAKTGTATKSVSVKDSTGATWPDEDWLSGTLRETRTLTGVGGAEVSGAIMDPRTGDPTVSDGRATTHQPGTARTRTRESVSAGTRRGVTTVTAWDSFGQPTIVEDEGDTAVNGDETCSRTTYATPVATATDPIDRIATTSTMPALCATPENLAQVTAAARHYYGASALGSVAAPGLETKTQQYTGSGANRAWAMVTQSSYDQWGRLSSVTDALGNTTGTAYENTPGGLLSTLTITSADPDGSGDVTPLVTTTRYDTRRGLPTQVVQPAGQNVRTTYDALGRATQQWRPGRDADSQSPSTTTEYTISSTVPSTVTTRTLLPSGDAYATTVTLLDSFLRTRQVQTQAATGTGRLINDTRYDSRSNAVLTDSYYNSTSPNGNLVLPTSRVGILTSHRFSYDEVGRQTEDAFYSAEALKWQTTTSYTGDSVSTVPPTGGTPTTVVSDIEGRTTRLIQHLGTDTAAPGATTIYSYDPAGNLATMTDPKGNVWHYTYDLAGNKLTADDPDKGLTSMAYDAVNRLTSSTDARGVSLKYFYDALGRATRTTKADGTTVLTSAVWDTVAKGLRTSSSRHLDGGTFTQRVDAYDAAGRPTSTTTVVPPIPGLIDSELAGSYTTTTSYNADGSLAAQTLPEAGPLPAETLTTGYTAMGYADTLTGTLGATTATYVTDTQYLAWGTMASMLLGTHAGKAVQNVYTRDTATLRLTRTHLLRQVNAGHTDETAALTYDPAGNITQVKATLDGGTVDNQCFSYDYQQQLTEAWTPAGDSCDAGTRSQATLAGPAPYWTSWSTDTIGKTASRTDRSPTTASTTTYSYNADGADSVTPHFITGTATTGDATATGSYGADPAGNTVSRPGTGGAQTLTWDDQNQLTTVAENGQTTARMAYDAAGGRVLRQQGGATTLYLAGTELTFTSAVVQAPLVADTSSQPSLTGLRYYTHAGQVVAVRTGASNDTVTTLVSDWQGTTHHQISNATGALATTWQDPYGNRRGTPPSAWTGDRSFVGGTRDSTGLIRIGARDYDPGLGRFITVDPVQDITDPLQWNPYLYANNTPITKADPTGNAVCIDSCDWDRRRFTHKYRTKEAKVLTGYYLKGTTKKAENRYNAHPGPVRLTKKTTRGNNPHEAPKKVSHSPQQPATADVLTGMSHYQAYYTKTAARADRGTFGYRGVRYDTDALRATAKELRFFKTLGAAGGAVSFAVDAFEGYDYYTSQSMGSTEAVQNALVDASTVATAGALGAWAGAIVGGAVGGPVGAFVGGFVGSWLGSWMGSSLVDLRRQW